MILPGKAISSQRLGLMHEAQDNQDEGDDEQQVDEAAAAATQEAEQP